MWIELLKPAGDLTPGFHDIADEGVARAYIAAGLAKEAGDGPDKIIMQRAMATFREELSGFTRSVAGEIQDVARSLSPGRIDAVAGGAQADKTKGVTDFCRNVFKAETSKDQEEQAAAYRRLTVEYGVKRAMGEGSGAGGGFTTTVQIETEIMKVAAESAIIRPRARIVPLGAREVYWPALDQYRTPAAGQSAMFGGVQVYRKGENVQRTESDPNTTQVKLVAQDLTALSKVGRDYMADSAVPVDALITDLMGGAIGWREDWEGLNGSGSGMMQGIYSAPCTIQVTRTGGAGTATFAYVDAVGMKKYLMPSAANGVVWVMHPFMMPLVETMTDPTGKYIFIPNVVASGNDDSPAALPTPGRLLGIPIFLTEKAPAPGSPGDVALAHWPSYLLGSRSGLEIGLSEHFAFDTDEIVFRAKIRNDGQPWLKKAITLADGAGTNKVSAFVCLN